MVCKASPLASSPESAVKFSTVGIYRPPAARKALKFSESAIQLAPPAAGDNPNDYNHYHPHPSPPPAQQQVSTKSAPEETVVDPPAKPPPSATGGSKSPCKPTAGSVSSGAALGETGYDSRTTPKPTKVITTGLSKLPAADATPSPVEATDSNNNNNNNTHCSNGNEQPLVAAAATSQGNQTASSTTTTTRPARPPRERRPDRAVYIPRARRSLTTPPVTITSQQTITSASTNATSPSIATSPPSESTTGSLSTFATPLSSPPKAAASSSCKKERSNSEKERKPKTKDKPPPLDCGTNVDSVIGNHRNPISNSSTKAECASSLSFKNRSHSVEESTPTTGTNQETVKLKKQKSEEVPRENVDQDCQFVPKPERKKERKEPRSNGGILAELNGSTNLKALDNMNKSNRNRSSKGNAVALIINEKVVPDVSDKIDKDEKELRRASLEINRSNRRLIKQSFASDVLEIAEQESSTANHPLPD